MDSFCSSIYECLCIDLGVCSLGVEAWVGIAIATCRSSIVVFSDWTNACSLPASSFIRNIPAALIQPADSSPGDFAPPDAQAGIIDLDGWTEGQEQQRRGGNRK